MCPAGLSKTRLKRMDRILSGHVERKEMPGLVALVSRGEDVHVEALGTLTFNNPAPMSRDTIFRIASLAKPVTRRHTDCGSQGRSRRRRGLAACWPTH